MTQGRRSKRSAAPYSATHVVLLLAVAAATTLPAVRAQDCQPIPTVAGTYANYAGSCTTGTVAAGTTCELICPVIMTHPDHQTVEVVTCYGGVLTPTKTCLANADFGHLQTVESLLLASPTRPVFLSYLDSTFTIETTLTPQSDKIYATNDDDSYTSGPNARRCMADGSSAANKNNNGDQYCSATNHPTMQWMDWFFQKLMAGNTNPADMLAFSNLGYTYNSGNSIFDVSYTCPNDATVRTGQLTMGFDGREYRIEGFGGDFQNHFCREIITSCDFNGVTYQDGDTFTPTCDANSALSSNAPSSVTCVTGVITPSVTCHPIVQDNGNAVTLAESDKTIISVRPASKQSVTCDKIVIRADGGDKIFFSHLSIYDFNNNNVLADFKIRDVADLPECDTNPQSETICGRLDGHLQMWSDVFKAPRKFLYDADDFFARAQSSYDKIALIIRLKTPTAISRVDIAIDGPNTAILKTNSNPAYEVTVVPSSFLQTFYPWMSPSDLYKPHTLAFGDLALNVRRPSNPNLVKFIIIEHGVHSEKLKMFMLTEIKIQDASGEISGIVFRDDLSQWNGPDGHPSNLLDGDITDSNRYRGASNGVQFVASGNHRLVFELPSETEITSVTFYPANYYYHYEINYYTIAGALTEAHIPLENHKWLMKMKDLFADQTSSYYNADPTTLDFKIGGALPSVEVTFPNKYLSYSLMTPEASIVDQSGSVKATIGYPFMHLDMAVQSGSSMEIIVDGVQTTFFSTVTYTTGSVTPQAESSRWSWVLVDDTYAFAAHDVAIANRDFCGDSIVNDGEECDDGNIFNNDGCSSVCKIEERYNCTNTNWKAESSFITTADGQCVGVSTCGDGILDHSIAFSTQQKYRRIPASQITENPDNNLVDPNVCAVRTPASSLCSVNGDVTFTLADSVKLSQITVHASAQPTVQSWNGDCSVPFGTPTVITGTSPFFQLKLDPEVKTCVKVSAGVDVYSVKLYEEKGHIELCDGESYCDAETCQLKPTAYCKPRPNPVPNIIFSARRSPIEYNSMFSGLSTALPEASTYAYWPRLQASAGAIARSYHSGDSRSVISGAYDLVPAGGSLSLGATGSFATFVKLTGDTTIASFEREGSTVTLSFASNELVLSHVATLSTLPTTTQELEDWYNIVGASAWTGFTSKAETGESGFYNWRGMNGGDSQNKVRGCSGMIIYSSVYRFHQATRFLDANEMDHPLLGADDGGSNDFMTGFLNIYKASTTIYSGEYPHVVKLMFNPDGGDVACRNDINANTLNNWEVGQYMWKSGMCGCLDTSVTSSKSTAFTPEAGKETFVAATFDAAEVKAYVAKEGEAVQQSESLTVGDASDVKLKKLHLSEASLEYMTMLSVYNDRVLSPAEIDDQFEFQDVYGAGLNCTEDARAMDGVVDNGEECDDGNADNADMCRDDGTVNPSISQALCVPVDYWDSSVPVTKVTFTGSAKIEEIVFYDSLSIQLKPSVASISSLHDGIRNTPGQTADLAVDVNTATFTFSEGVNLEYIRVFNSRSASDNSNEISAVEVSVNGNASFKIGVASEWNGAGGVGGCTDAQYPCFVDLIHDAKQSHCAQQCDAHVENGQCYSGGRYMPLGESCTITCNAPYGLGDSSPDANCADGVAFSISSCTPCHGRGTHRSHLAGMSCKCDSGSFGDTCQFTRTEMYDRLGDGYGDADKDNFEHRKRMTTTGVIDKGDVASSKMKLSGEMEGKSMRMDSGDLAMPEFTVVSLPDNVQANIDVLFPSQQFKVLLRFDTADGSQWTAPADKKLDVRFEKPNGYDISTAKPLFGYFIDETDGTLTKLPTSYDFTSNEFIFEVRHFSLYGVDEAEPRCGNGQVEYNETCDDENTEAGDGCSSICTVEAGYECTGDFNTKSVCTDVSAVCGDGAKSGVEQCDDGDTGNGDGCSSTCTIENGWQCTDASCTAMQPHCGDGQRVGSELAGDKCDLGGMDSSAPIVISGETGSNQYYTINGQQNPTLYLIVGQEYTFVRSALSGHPFKISDASGNPVVSPPSGAQPNTFTFTPGAVGTYTYVCTIHGVMTGSIIVQSDNNDNAALSGCSKTCSVHDGWAYDGSGNLNPVCGDSKVLGTEACDDGNTNGGDGCSADCTTIEPNWWCTGGSASSAHTCAACEVCSTGQYRDGCGNEQEGTCTACTNANTNGDVYYSDHGHFANSCPTSTCDSRATTECTTNGQYLNGCGNGNAGTCAICSGGLTDAGARYITTGGRTETGCQSGVHNDGNKDPAGYATDGSNNLVAAEACDNEGKNGCLVNGAIHGDYNCVDSGFGTVSVCTPKCGDNKLSPHEDDVMEQCDDGDLASGDLDGCSSTCTIETGYTCEVDPCTQEEATTRSTQMFTTQCGDGLWAEGSAEQCDDGNTEGGDGCESNCEVQNGYGCSRDLDAGQQNTTCIVIATANADDVVLTIDAPSNCAVFTASAGSSINYASDPNVNALRLNRTSGGTINNCFVCQNAIQINMPAPTAAHPLSTRPVFLGANCELKYPDGHYPSDDNHLCAAYNGNDGRLTAGEECDDANTINNDGCTGNAIDSDPQVNRVGFHIASVQGDGYITVSTEEWDNNGALRSQFCDLSSGASDACVAKNKAKNQLLYHSIKQHGESAVDVTMDKAAVFEFFRFATDNERFKVQFLQNNPSEVKTAARVISDISAANLMAVVQCAKSEGDTMTAPSWDDAIGYNDCSGPINPTAGTTTQCKIVDPSSEIETVQYCGTQKLQAPKHRLYVFSKTSGNLFANVTLRTGSDEFYNEFRYLNMLSFMPKLYVGDVSDVSFLLDGGNNREEKSTAQLFNFDSVQPVNLHPNVDDGFYVRRVKYQSTNAERYADISAHVNSESGTVNNVSPQKSGNVLYFSSLTNGDQKSRAQYTVGAYENTVAQAGKMQVDLTSLVYACDQNEAFSKTASVSNVGISAVVFHKETINDNLVMILPESYNERESFNLGLTWNTDGDDTSLTRTWNSVTCCTNAETGKEYPTFSSPNTSLTVTSNDECFTLTTTAYTTHSQYADRNQMLQDGLVVEVEPCRHASQDFNLDCTVERIEDGPESDLQAKETPTNSKQATEPVLGIAVVDDLSDNNSFEANVPVVLEANGPAKNFKVCTYVSNVTLLSNCENSELVSNVGFTASGFEVNSVSGVGFDSEYLLLAGQQQNAGISQINFDSSLGPDQVEHCDTYSLSASAKAATCGAASISLQRDHEVTEKGVKYSESQPASIVVKEIACPFDLTGTSLLSIIEDTAFELKNLYTVKRQPNCGATEHVKQIKFTISYEFYDKFTLADQVFQSDGTLTFDKSTPPLVSSVLEAAPELFDSSSVITFKNDVKLNPVADFNTINQSTITLRAEFKSESCDNDNIHSSYVDRNIRVQDIVDTCKKTAFKSPLEGKRGRWIAQSINATISNLDERRNFKLQITSNFAIEARIGLSGTEIDCQNGNQLNEKQTCDLYCTADGTITGQTSVANWALVSGTEYECTPLKSLYIRPKYDATDTDGATTVAKDVVTLATFNGCKKADGQVAASGDFDADTGIRYPMYCNHDASNTYETYTLQTFESPFYQFYLDLLFSSSIADSLSATYECDNKPVASSTLAHRMYIGFVAIYGEVYVATSATNANVDVNREWTANGEVSETSYNIDGTDLNNGNTLVYFKRRAHELYNIMENSLEVHPSVVFQDCRNNEGNLINISVEFTSANVLQGIFWSGVDDVNTYYIQLKTPDNEHIASNCRIEVLMEDKTADIPSPIFFPLYTTSAKLTFNVVANLGDVVVVETPSSTSASSFPVKFERQLGNDGVLEANFTLDFSGCTNLNHLASVSIEPSVLTWDDEEEGIKSATITKTNAQDCSVKIIVTKNGLPSTEIKSIWLSGGLGSFSIDPHPYEVASYSLLRAIGHNDGQKFRFKREDVEPNSRKAQFIIRSDQDGVLINNVEELTLTWEDDDDVYDRAVFVKYANAPTDGNLVIKITLQSYQDPNWQNQDTQTFSISIDNDLNSCAWASFESVSVSADSPAQPEAASLYSAYVDKYVILYENAAAFNTLGQTFSDVVSLTVQRPVKSVGNISIQLELITFDREQTGVLALQSNHFEDLLGTVYHMADGETSKEITLKIKNDDLNYGDRLGFLVVNFGNMATRFSSALGDDASSAIAACNSQAAKDTALSSDIKSVLNNYSADQRRLLQQAAAVRPGDGSGNIRTRDDDINEPLTQDRTNEAVTARFWSGASLDTWNSALQVEMTFKLPIYTADHANDRYYGSFAMIGSCPTNATTLFSQLPTCSTFVPLSPEPADTTAYVRMLSGHDNNTFSNSNCSNAAWPCANRWVQPTTIGFSEAQTDMTGHSLGVDLPIYPYKFSTSLTELKQCKSYDESGVLKDAVTTTTSTGTTAYGFETCIVTYGQRFADVSDSDVVLHTAQQSVQLESSDEAVVTALMFELNEKIRVSVVPRQRQCSGCTANYGPQYDTCNQGHSVQLLLDATIDVPFDTANTYKYTGVFDVQSILGAATGCHWDTSSPVYLDDSTYTVRQITRTESRNGQPEQTYEYIRTEFTLKSACISAHDGTNIVSDIFQTCADTSKDPNDYDFLVQLGSCKTIEQLQQCAELSTDDVCADNCIKTGNDEAPTLIQADVSFAERPPTFDMRESTAISLETDLFKFGSSEAVKYELDHRFTSKDTIVMVVAPKDAESFDGPEFGLTCPDTHLAAYNPVSSLCTTDQAQRWTFNSLGTSSTDSQFDHCVSGGRCTECENYDFPLALAGQSVMFDSPQTVRICHNATHMKKSMDVYMLDFVHTYWFEFYEYDYRAVAADCDTKGNCRRACDGISNPVQVEQGCGKYCGHFSAFGGGKWITPILTASAISKNGDIVPSLQDGLIANSLSDAKMCKHDNATRDGFGNIDGWSEEDVCNGQDAKTPQHCGFSGLEGSSFSSTNKRISAGLSIFAGGLLANTLYSLSAHCFITNCKATNNASSARRLLSDVSVNGGQLDDHTPAAGVKFFKIMGETSTTASDSDVVGLGSTIAITLGVVALVVIALLAVSWIYMYRRVYSTTSALPVHVPSQQQPLLHRAPAQQPSWNF